MAHATGVTSRAPSTSIGRTFATDVADPGSSPPTTRTSRGDSRREVSTTASAWWCTAMRERGGEKNGVTAGPHSRDGRRARPSRRRRHRPPHGNRRSHSGHGARAKRREPLRPSPGPGAVGDSPLKSSPTRDTRRKQSERHRASPREGCDTTALCTRNHRPALHGVVRRTRAYENDLFYSINAGFCCSAPI